MLHFCASHIRTVSAVKCRTGLHFRGYYHYIYAEYDLENSQVCDALKVILCREDGFDYEMAYQLNAEEKSAILDKMGQYCREKYGQSLLEFAAEMESEITAMETPQM